jgi:hypothetical protein
MIFSNQKLVDILNDALYDYIEHTTEEWLQFSLSRENNTELEFYRLMEDRSVTKQQIENLITTHEPDTNLSVTQVLEFFITALGGQKWTAEEAAALRSDGR